MPSYANANAISLVPTVSFKASTHAKHQPKPKREFLGGMLVLTAAGPPPSLLDISRIVTSASAVQE